MSGSLRKKDGGFLKGEDTLLQAAPASSLPAPCRAQAQHCDVGLYVRSPLASLPYRSQTCQPRQSSEPVPEINFSLLLVLFLWRTLTDMQRETKYFNGFDLVNLEIIEYVLTYLQVSCGLCMSGGSCSTCSFWGILGIMLGDGSWLCVPVSALHCRKQGFLPFSVCCGIQDAGEGVQADVSR